MILAQALRKQFAPRSHTGRYVGVALACGALASLAALAWNVYRLPTKYPRPAKHADAIRDKSLKDSFPASDPPASQYFDIPANRL